MRSTAMVPLVVAALYGVGTYLILQRTLTRIILGLALIGHGANLLLLLAGGGVGWAPIIEENAADALPGSLPFSDPLPQALVLTAIVISLGTTAFVLVLAYRSWTVAGNDEVEDDIEDRRIARRQPQEDYTSDGADRPSLLPEQILKKEIAKEWP